MNIDQRPARAPGTVSVTDLMMNGLLCEHDIRMDGTVNEVSRAIAEQEYRKHEASILQRSQTVNAR